MSLNLIFSFFSTSPGLRAELPKPQRTDPRLTLSEVLQEALLSRLQSPKDECNGLRKEPFFFKLCCSTNVTLLWGVLSQSRLKCGARGDRQQSWDLVHAGHRGPALVAICLQGSCSEAPHHSSRPLGGNFECAPDIIKNTPSPQCL